MTLAVLPIIVVAAAIVVGVTSLVERWLEHRDKEHDRKLAVAVQDETDCYAWCFVSYAGRNYDDVCPDHFDQIGREVSRG